MDVSLKHTNKLQLSEDIIKGLKVTRAFKDSATPLNCMDWDKEGEFLITSSNDEMLYLYSISTGEIYKILHSKKGLTECIRFSFQSSKHCICIVKSSYDRKTSVIKNWDIFENTFTHARNLPARAISLAIHPHRTIMLICCSDGLVHLYSLEGDKPLVSISSAINYPCAAFDTEGFIFACYLGYQKLHLFDCNNYLQGEFYIFDLKSFLKENEHITSIAFSSNGASIVVRSNFGSIFRLDAFTGNLLSTYLTENDNGEAFQINCQPSISPDSQYLFCGSRDKSVNVWDLSSSRLINKLTGHAGVLTLVQFNPKKALVASACINLAWWTPNENTPDE